MNRFRSLGAAALLAAGLFTGACAGPATSGAARGTTAAPVDPDSVLARAERGRLKGAETATLTIVEISDFQCPYCRDFAANTYPRLDSAYIRTGRAKMLYINLPLTSHQQAFGAAEAAMCAGAQDRFWPMHDRLFATQRDWSGKADAPARFQAFAGELGLNAAAFRDCTDNDRTASLIVGDAMSAAGAGITGTPAFVITSAGGQQVLSGAVPFEQIAQVVDSLLNAPPRGAQPPAPAQPRP